MNDVKVRNFLSLYNFVSALEPLTNVVVSKIWYDKNYVNNMLPIDTVHNATTLFYMCDNVEFCKHLLELGANRSWCLGNVSKLEYHLRYHGNYQMVIWLQSLDLQLQE